MATYTMQVRFRSPTGHVVSVECDESQFLEVLARFGARRFIPESLPPGGLSFPYANHEGFNWALIGAKAGTVERAGQQTEGVWWGGNFYTKREFEEESSRKTGKRPQAVKYSRGAKSTDPVEVREKSDGEIEYVTLISFRGSGPALKGYSEGSS